MKMPYLHEMPMYKGYEGYYYYDDEDKILVGRVCKSPTGKMTDMVAWYDENEDLMEPLFYSMVDDYISFKKDIEKKYGKPKNRRGK